MLQVRSCVRVRVRVHLHVRVRLHETCVLIISTRFDLVDSLGYFTLFPFLSFLLSVAFSAVVRTRSREEKGEKEKRRGEGSGGPAEGTGFRGSGSS